MMIQPVQCVFPAAAAEPLDYGDEIGSAEATSSGTTISIIVPAGGVPVGKHVVLVFGMDQAAGTISAADSRGNAYTERAAVNASGPAYPTGRVFSAPVTTELEPGDTITVTHPSVASRTLLGVYLQGVDAADPVEYANARNLETLSSSSGALQLAWPPITTVATLVIGGWMSRNPGRAWTTQNSYTAGQAHAPGGSGSHGGLVNYRAFAGPVSGSGNEPRASCDGPVYVAALTVAFKA